MLLPKKERKVTHISLYPKYPFEKFKHVTMGVIHPSPEGKGAIKRNRRTKKELEADNNLKMAGVGIPLELKGQRKKPLPDHLERPYIYISKLVPKNPMLPQNIAKLAKKRNKGNAIHTQQQAQFQSKMSDKNWVQDSDHMDPEVRAERLEKYRLDQEKKKRLESQQRETNKDWDKSTHTQYIDKERLYKIYSANPFEGSSQKVSKAEREKLYKENQTLKDNTFKLFSLMKENFVGEQDPSQKQTKINPKQIEKDLHQAYKALKKQKVINSENQKMKSELVGILKKGTEKRKFFEKQKQYSDKLAAVEQRKIEDKKDRELLGKTLNPFESMIQSFKYKVPVGPEKNFEELQADQRKESILKKKKTKEDVQLLLEKTFQPLGNNREALKNAERASKHHIPRSIFQQYMVAIGVDPVHMPLMNNIFDSYSDTVLPPRSLKVDQQMDLKVFLFNFRKWLSSKFEQRDLVSTKKAADKNSILKDYLTESAELFPNFRLNNITKENEEAKKSIMKSEMPSHEYLLLDRKQVALFHYKHLKDIHQHDQHYLEGYDGQPFKMATQKKHFESFCGDLPINLKRKKTTTQFLFENIQPGNFRRSTLINSLDLLSDNLADHLEKMGGLIQKYKQYKVQFKELKFTLFDIANYIHEQIADEEENQLLFLLINLFKEDKNKQRNQYKEAQIDPKEEFDLKDLDDAFHKYCDKNTDRISIISRLIEGLESYLRTYGHSGNNQQVNKAVHDNLVSKYLLDYFGELDKSIETAAIKTIQLDAVYDDAGLQDNWKMPKKALQAINHILEVPNAQQVFLKGLVNVSINPLSVNMESQVLKNQKTEDLIKKTVNFVDKLRDKKKQLEEDKQKELSKKLGTKIDYSLPGPLLKNSTNQYAREGHQSGMINLERIRPTHHEMASVYPAIFPPGYYDNVMTKERLRSKDDKWYLRPHHIESLTDHPYSLKDNVMDSNYYSFYEGMKRNVKGEYVDPEVIRESKKPTDTENLINNLEDHISNLKSQLTSISKSGGIGPVQGRVSAVELNPYYQMPERAELDPSKYKTKAYEGILDQLRNEERRILNRKRESERSEFGEPQKQWYASKGPEFTREMKKHDRLLDMDDENRRVVMQLSNNELY